MDEMTKTRLVNSEAALKQQLDDPEFRREWERTAVARAVAMCLLKYRRAHALSQTALGRRLGMKQPAVARLEAGDHTPRLETLVLISRALGIEFLVDIGPPRCQSGWLTDAVKEADVVQNVESPEGKILIAAKSTGRPSRGVRPAKIPCRDSARGGP